MITGLGSYFFRIGFIPFTVQILVCLLFRKNWVKAIPILITTGILIAHLVLAVLIENPSFPLDPVEFFSGNSSWVEDHWLMVWIYVAIPPIQGLGWLAASIIKAAVKRFRK